MIFIENLHRRFQVEIVLRLLVPGQFHHPFEIGPDGGGFGGVRMHFLQSLELFFRFLEDLVGHLGIFDAFPEFSDLLGPFVEFA